MQSWPDRRLLELLKLEIPIIQAPMAGSDSVALARSVSSTGALGSLACALLSPDDVRGAVHKLRDGMDRPFNLNFFCHTMAPPDAAAIEKWKRFLRPHYERLGLNIENVAESGFVFRSTKKFARWWRKSDRRSSVFISDCPSLVSSNGSRTAG